MKLLGSAKNRFIRLFISNTIYYLIFIIFVSLLCILLPMESIYAITDNIIIIKDNPPRRASHGNAPGSYEIIVSANKQTIKPGDPLKIEIYITGYGQIEGAKIMFSAPTDFILIEKDQTYSKINLFGFSSKQGKLFGPHFVSQVNPLDGKGSITHTQNIKAKHNNEDILFITPYVDKYYADNSTLSLTTATIFTELSINGRPPIEYSLLTSKKSTSGIHQLKFYFTYFNGSEWKSSVQSIDIEVPTRYKRYELWIWLSGLLLTLLIMPPHAIDRVKRAIVWIINKTRDILHT